MGIMDFITGHPFGSAGIGIGAILLGVILARLGKKTFGKLREKNLQPPVLMAGIGAILATGISGDTAWRFAGDNLGIRNPFERGFLFAVGEIILFSLALMARANLRQDGKTGAPGILIWILSGFLAVPAFSEAATLPAALFRVVMGPLASAVLWHLAMGVELKHSNPDAENRGMLASVLRQIRERLLARFGFIAADKDAEEIAADRAVYRAAELVDKYMAIPEGSRNKRRALRIARKLRTSLRKARVATSPERKEILLAELSTSRHATALATVNLVSPWIASEVVNEIDNAIPSEVVSEVDNAIPSQVDNEMKEIATEVDNVFSKVAPEVVTEVASLPVSTPRQVVTVAATKPATRKPSPHRKTASSGNRDDRVKEAFANGVPASELASELGISRQAVNARYAKLRNGA